MGVISELKFDYLIHIWVKCTCIWKYRIDNFLKFSNSTLRISLLKLINYMLTLKYCTGCIFGGEINLVISGKFRGKLIWWKLIWRICPEIILNFWIFKSYLVFALIFIYNLIFLWFYLVFNVNLKWHTCLEK